MTRAVRYRVRHATHYAYQGVVSRSQQLLHLAPRAHPRQRCLDHELAIEPAPSRRSDRIDGFGNPVSVLEFERAHRTLAIVSSIHVELRPRARPVDEASSPPWEDVAARYAYRAARALDDADFDAIGFRFESPFVGVDPRFADYARECFGARTPLLAAAQALMEKIHREFTYEPGATQIATPLAEVLATRRGVCQDYAHFMLACLRALGLPARYVSGYLRTRPPPGRPRLVGADASHAWVAVYCPANGWVDFDPTNRVRPELEHVTLAWGRDFGDVSPQRGVILGSGTHALTVDVSVTPEPDAH
ncbi:MAG TPA: transglutaminase family protein [Dokdonella sp.]